MLPISSDPGGLWTKNVFDASGNLTGVYQTDGAGGNPFNSSGDHVISHVVTAYDGDGNAILTQTTNNTYNASGNLTNSMTSSVASYYDAANRLIATADYGTNAPTIPTPGAQPPGRSATVHVTSYNYDAGGFLQDTTDPNATITHRVNDNLGRIQTEFDNYVQGGPQNASTNRVTGYTYTPLDQLHTVTVTNYDPTTPLSLTNPVLVTTTYTYGVSATTGSAVSSNDLLYSVTSQTGNVFYRYDALGDQIGYNQGGTLQTNGAIQGGTDHQLTYDSAGRLVRDYADLLATNVDGSVRTLTYAYDALGNQTLASSLDSSGNPVNQVQNTYNGFGQLASQSQSHNGAVNGTTPVVQYAYDQSNNHSRLASITYPSGYTITYGYTGSALDSAISRADSISDPTTSSLETYSYLGLSNVVGRTLSQPGISEMVTLDAFGNTNIVNWTKGNNSIDEYQYTYDADGNMLARYNLAANIAGDTQFGQLFTYNSLGYLTNYEQGTLSGGSITNAVKNISFSPDSMGSRQDPNYALASAYSNEVQDGLPQSILLNTDSEGDAETATNTFDAWGRLKQVTGDGQTITYTYDALGRRITSTEGSGSDSYYDGNNVIEERNAQGNVTARYVWSAAGGNRLVLRDQGGQRLYALQDASGSTTAITDASGNVVERYTYGPDGTPVAYQSNWTLTEDSNGNFGNTLQGWDILWNGLRWHPLYTSTDASVLTAGLYEQMSGGQWYDPQHGTRVQPNLAPPPDQNPYNVQQARDAYSSFFPTWYLNAGDVALSSLQVAAAVASFVPAAAPFAIPISIALNGAGAYAAGESWSEVGEGVAINSALAGLPLGLSYVPGLVSDSLYTARLAASTFIRWNDEAAQGLIAAFGGRTPPPALALVDGGTIVAAGGSEAAEAAAAGAGGWNGAWGGFVGWSGALGNAGFSIFFKQIATSEDLIAARIRLTPNEIAQSDYIHFKSANQALADQLESAPVLENRYRQIYGDDFVDAILEGETPEDWTWHHALRSQANGEAGWLYLIPREYHQTNFGLLHPNGYGGYEEWALPAGAPSRD